MAIERSFNVREKADGKWEVENRPGKWVNCSQEDAELLVRVRETALGESSQFVIRQTIAALERIGYTMSDLPYRFLSHQLEEKKD